MFQVQSKISGELLTVFSVVYNKKTNTTSFLVYRQFGGWCWENATLYKPL